jgi:hypothetical protein
VSLDVATDLLGEIVEIYEHDSHRSGYHYNLRGRGVVRALYVADSQLQMLVEHNLGYESATHSERAKDGGVEVYAIHRHRVRVVQRCVKCVSWDQKALLVATYPGEGLEKVWEHKSGEGCKKVGHGG